MARSYKQLKDLAIAANQNLKRIGVIENFRIGVLDYPKSYTIHNAKNYLACSGNLVECMSFLYGINWLVSNNLYKPVGFDVHVPCTGVHSLSDMRHPMLEYRGK